MNKEIQDKMLLKIGVILEMELLTQSLHPHYLNLPHHIGELMSKELNLKMKVELDLKDLIGKELNFIMN